MSKPRLLFLCQTLPYPPDSGVNLRAYHSFRMLATLFEVTALFFFRRAYRPTAAQRQESLAHLATLGPSRAFPIEQEWSRPRLMADHLRSLTRARVYTHYAYQSQQFATALDGALASRPDAIHVDSLDLVAYLPLLEARGIPVALTHHNVESDLLRRRSAQATSWAVRRYLAHQAALYERVERYWAPRVAVNVTVSEEDARTLRQRIPNANVTTIPSGVELRTHPDARATVQNPPRVVFVGGLDWFPNRDALDFYCTDVLPRVRAQRPTVETTFVGRATAEDIAQYRARGVTLTGHVPSIEPYVRDADCFIVPLRVGGGTRLKVLDGWSLGAPVVSTMVGCEGLDARHGDNALLADTAQEMADAILAVLADPGLANRLRVHGWETVRDHYSWDAIAPRIEATYSALVASQGARHAAS